MVRAADEVEAHRKLQSDDNTVYLHQKDGQWHLDGYDKTPSVDRSSIGAVERAVAVARRSGACDAPRPHQQPGPPQSYPSIPWHPSPAEQP
jgi:hypothetical protein